MKPERRAALIRRLDDALASFVIADEARADAIEPALRYPSAINKEMSSFICAVLAYGRVEHIKKSAHRILDPMGPDPLKWLLMASDADIGKLVRGWSHRFNTAADMKLFLCLLREVYLEAGSLEAFMCSAKPQTAYELLESFVLNLETLAKNKKIRLPPRSGSFWFLLPRPSSGSACKRLNLFLRWMVGRGPMDFGIWKEFERKNLVIPLDVHVLRQAKSLRLTIRKQADWVAVEEVTGALKELDPEDPVRFDFALCHLGMKGQVLKNV